MVNEGPSGALARLHPRFREDEEVVRAAILQSNGKALRWASEALRNDPQIVLSAVQASKDGSVLQFAGHEARANGDVVREAVRLSAWNLAFAGEALRGNKEVRMLT